MGKEQIALDPVCGMEVTRSSTAISRRVGSVEYYFCSLNCAKRFVDSPNKFLKPAKLAQCCGDSHSANTPQDAFVDKEGSKQTYVCPMHPEITKIGAGSCKICGMALEPLDPMSGDESSSTELRAMKWRFLAASLFSLPLAALSMGGMLNEDLTSSLGITANSEKWLELCLASVVVFGAGSPLIKLGFLSLWQRSFNMFTLILIGVGTSFVYSVVGLIAPELFPPALVSHHGQIDLYFEAAAVITTLVLLGQYMELKARAGASRAIQNLLTLVPSLARRVNADGTEVDINPEDILQGDLLRVRPGDLLPTDGVIETGSGSIDETMISGESLPVEKQPGSRVIGSTMNLNGSFVMRAESVGAETYLAKMVRMVATAQRSRAPIQRLTDIVSAYFVWIVMGIAFVTLGIWLKFGPEPRLTFAILASISVLLVACPCALGLAAPMSIMVATARAAVKGVLYKNAEALEALASIDTLVIDKTGTLTEGKARVAKLMPRPGKAESDLLKIAASIEKGSAHPLAKALLQEASMRGVDLVVVDNFSSEVGKGICGAASGQRFRLGNLAYMQELGLSLGALEEACVQEAKLGRTVVYLCDEAEIWGAISIGDPIKSTARQALEELKAEHLTIVMLTGDHPLTATAVANELGIAECYAELLPSDKANFVSKLRASGHKVAVAGDGINDALALSVADVGIAMGNGAEVSIESAGITLARGELLNIVKARKISKETMKNITQNLWFAFGYNAVGIPIAAGVLYPFLGMLMSPMLAAAAMSFSSVSVILNSLRLMRK